MAHDRGQADEPPFRCGVMREPGHAAQAGHRRVVDDHAAAALDHDRDDPASDHPGALQVDVDHGIPGVLGQLVGQAVTADARVVEQDVDAAEMVDRGTYGGADGRIVANIGGEGQAFDSQRAALLGQVSRSSAEPIG